jgi:hypothetical protein
MEGAPIKRQAGRQSKAADTGMMVDLSDTGFYVTPQRRPNGGVGLLLVVLEFAE